MLIVNNVLLVFFTLCLLLITTSSNATNTAAEKNQYLLQKIAQAPQIETKENQWIQLIEKPGENNYYYIANKQGQIYQFEQDKPNNNYLLLDLQKLPNQNPVLQLSAFALHPNFSQRDQEGYGTFYTAHVEKSITSNAKRLYDLAIKEPLPFDAVISEWRLNLEKPDNLSNQREILKIAIPTVKNTIQQLSFNPYRKSWHDDFSQLYISIAQSPKLKQYPLYSGAILRINPHQAVSGSYSVPHGNPYYANGHIEESIYLFGAGKIKQFLWPDKYSNKLLVSHQYSFNNTVRHWLSYSNGGEDWRTSPPKSFLYQSEQPLPANSILVYRGRNAPALRHKLLLLTQRSQQWQLSSLDSDETAIEAGLNPRQQPLSSPQLEWLLQQNLHGLQLSLYRDHRGELLFFNEDSGELYKLFQQDPPQGSQVTEQSTLGAVTIFIVIVLGLLAGYVFYQVNIQHKSAKALVRREFANLTLSSDKSEINLYKRHQHEVDKVIALADIEQCQLLLGDLVIATVNTALGHGFNDQQDSAVREIFHAEHISKMIDHKVRRISLSLNTSEKNGYIICLYLRKGSDRITKKSYFEVVEDVIDWCWLISAQINNEHTGKRSLKPTITAADIAQAEHKAHDHTPLHAQAAIIRPATHLQPSIKMTEFQQSLGRVNTNDNPATLLDQDVTTTIKPANVEIDLVNALEKLVKLQQQGFLTVDEFSQAKAKLINSVDKTE